MAEPSRWKGMTMTAVLFKDRALAMAERGFRVFPLAPCGKIPLTSHGCKDATNDLQQITTWWEGRPDANIGVATGAASGIIVLDIDGDEGEASLRKLEAEQGALPPTVEVITGGGGRHLYFQYPDLPIRNSAGKLGEGLDIRGDGGYVVAPPSIHQSGRAYIKSVDSQDKMARVPEWLLERIVSRDNHNASGYTEHTNFADTILAGIAEGCRNDFISRLAGKLLRAVPDPFLVLELCRCVNKAQCQPPLDDLEVKRTVNSIAKAEIQNRGGLA